MTLTQSQIALRKHASQKNKKINEWFFKTAPGQYGHGDQFIGVKIPQLKIVAKKFADLELAELKILISSPIHEDRMLGLVILKSQYQRAVKYEPKTALKLFSFAWAHKKFINNWDLVDTFVPDVFGHRAFEDIKIRKKVFSLVQSKSLWDRRIAMMSTFYFIRQEKFGPTVEICKKLLNDREDLMHKASGWMLREMGKRDLSVLLKFLNQHTLKMPRTMLRYAIEKLPEKQRLQYLRKKL